MFLNKRNLLALLMPLFLITGCTLKTTDTQTASTTAPAETVAVISQAVPSSSTLPSEQQAAQPATNPDTRPDTSPGDSDPIVPSKIRTGDAYDTETVRDWMWNTDKADYYPKEKLVFLTFDDGPSAKVTPEVLDVLKKNNVQGTFFYYTGSDLSGRAGIIQRTIAEGNVIGIHTSSHNYTQLYPKRIPDPSAILRDADKATTVIREVLGPEWKPSVYRFPGGSFSWTASKTAREAMDKTKAALKDFGLAYMDWNAMSGDSDTANKDKSAQGLARFVIRTTKNARGHVIVVLMHDNKLNTPPALQKVIDYFREEGYEFGVFK